MGIKIASKKSLKDLFPLMITEMIETNELLDDFVSKITVSASKEELILSYSKDVVHVVTCPAGIPSLILSCNAPDSVFSAVSKQVAQALMVMQMDVKGVVVGYDFAKMEESVAVMQEHAAELVATKVKLPIKKLKVPNSLASPIVKVAMPVGEVVEENGELIIKEVKKAVKYGKGVSVDEVEEVSLDQQKNGLQIKLEHATKMYEAVQGTDSTSRYYVIALSDKYKVAARYKEGKLSVRVEGNIKAPTVSSLKQCGFKVADGMTHASIHLSVANDMECMRALGALLLSLGVEYTTKLPKLGRVKVA